MKPTSAGLQYIVESRITVDVDEIETAPDLSGIRRVHALPPQFGFELVIWNPESPAVVRVFHWNTIEERRAGNGQAGWMRERPASGTEIEDGEAQHARTMQ